LHHWHAAHGARFTDWAGWQTVASYSSVEREVAGVRSGLGLADVSALAKVGLRGQGVPAVVQTLVPDDQTLSPRAVASVFGDSTLACRLTQNHLLLLDATPDVGIVWQRVTEVSRSTAVVQTDVTSAYAGFVSLGPGLDDCLRRVTSLDVRPASFPENSCAETALARVEALLVRRREGPLPALRIYVAWDLAEYVWERLLEAGRDRSITPIGFEALRLLTQPKDQGFPQSPGFS
jgi:aminomethyltransferase